MFILTSLTCRLIQVKRISTELTFIFTRAFNSRTTSSLYVTFFSMATSSTSDLDRSSKYFQGLKDRFDGLTIDSLQQHCDTKDFAKKLRDSLIHWQEHKFRGIWFKVALEHSEWVPILAQHGFWFHHAKPEYVTMCRWLPDPDSEPCNIPEYSHTMLGVGGLVTDRDGRLLVIKEKAWTQPKWKLPGGYVEKGEDISVAVVREVLEETGIKTTFNSVIAFRHHHLSQFGCSDIYLIAHLNLDGQDQDIKKCNYEIQECCWMKLEEYVEHPEVHDMNRMVVRKYMEMSKKGISMPSIKIPHPVNKDSLVSMYILDHTPK